MTLAEKKRRPDLYHAGGIRLSIIGRKTPFTSVGKVLRDVSASAHTVLRDFCTSLACKCTSIHQYNLHIFFSSELIFLHKCVPCSPCIGVVSPRVGILEAVGEDKEVGVGFQGAEGVEDAYGVQ